MVLTSKFEILCGNLNVAKSICSIPCTATTTSRRAQALKRNVMLKGLGVVIRFLASYAAFIHLSGRWGVWKRNFSPLAARTVLSKETTQIATHPRRCMCIVVFSTPVG
jgi:hypothetical protein